MPCGNNCNDIQVKIPHLKTTSDYSIVSIPYQPEAYVTPGGNELVSLYVDDKYSPLISLPFPVCFYDSVYSSVVVSSNGMLTFDASRAGGSASFRTLDPIPHSFYPPASIMGIHTDLDPRLGASPNDRKIEWRFEGIAPFRKFIVSYYHLGMFGASTSFCSRDAAGNPVSPTTFQIVIYEQSGLIDIFIENKTCHTTSTGGRVILGVQNWQKNKGVAAPNKNATVWPDVSNEAWRFVPSGSVSRFSKAEIYDITGVLLQTTTPADTSTSTPGVLDINFNNICFPGASREFVIKTYYTPCPTGNPLIITDTITALKGDLVTSTSSSAADCSPTGSATITLPAGGGPYTFTIGTNPPVTSLNNSYTFTGLIAGTYTLAGTNASGCSATKNVTVGINGTLNIQVTPTGASCSGINNGTIVLTPQNGIPPFQYNINNGAYQTSNTFSNLAPGIYIIGAKDSSGCVVANYSATVPGGMPVTASATLVNVSCNGGNSGSITVSLSNNAVAPLQYSLDGTTYQSSNTFNGLGAGNYTVYFKDANNCGGMQTFTITQPAALTQVITKEDALCNGQSNGRITVTAGGGQPGYQYSIDGVNYQAGNTFNVAANNYTVYVKDAAGCIVTGTATINQPAALSISAHTQDATCNGGADGKITVTAGGGTAAYQYSIDGAGFQTSNVFNVTRGNYTITVKDANGCIATTSAAVELTNNLTLSLPADTTICEGTAVQLSTNTNATQFSWSQAVSLNNATIANPIATPRDTTQYILTATLGACSVKDSVIVMVNSAPIADAGNNDEVCFGQGYVLQGNGGVSYEWLSTTYFNAGNTAVTQNPAITASQTTTYALMVTDAAGCKSLQPASVTITVTPPISVRASPKDTVVAKGDVFQLNATSAVIDYIWSPGFGLDNPAKQAPIVTVDRDITYVVTAYTGAGCKGTDTVTIKVYNGPEIYVPTAFTPNGDGKNDLLRPFPVGIKELRFFRVYNRWAQLVFQTSRLNAGWDGKISGILQPVATYVWVLEGVTKDGKVISKKGTTTLIR